GSINFLGHIVGKEGIRPDETKVAKVKNFPIPTNLRQLRGFIGLASYYRRFIPGFASIAKPLHKLLEKDTPYSWGPEQEKAFQALKVCLTTAPVLSSEGRKQERICNCLCKQKPYQAGKKLCSHRAGVLRRGLGHRVFSPLPWIPTFYHRHRPFSLKMASQYGPERKKGEMDSSSTTL
ncbi:3821_t:CDS:2, partial [Dentiscutata heterogama]